MGTNVLGLIIESFQDPLAGNYTCTANYGNQKLAKSVRLESVCTYHATDSAVF